MDMSNDEGYIAACVVNEINEVIGVCAGERAHGLLDFDSAKLAVELRGRYRLTTITVPREVRDA